MVYWMSDLEMFENIVYYFQIEVLSPTVLIKRLSVIPILEKSS